MQGSLFDSEQNGFDGNLPDQSRMPLNLGKRTVHSVVDRDLCNERGGMVVTGFGGLEQLIQLITGRGVGKDPLRIILGSDPITTQNPKINLRSYDFSAEMRAYWLERGISLSLCGQVLHCIELIHAGHVQIRYPTGYRRLHAKMYCSAGAVTVGSSNYTAPGFHSQHEANVRFTCGEKARFDETSSLAEYFWCLGKNAEDAFIELLEDLLKFVTWQEALARACGELLESDWAQSYLDSLFQADPVELWPSQRQGIAQALYLLDTVGAVLIADATGSGKTRLGAHLIRSILDRNWSLARGRKGSMLLICPPLVKKNWERESAKCGYNIAVASHGLLSRLKAEDVSSLATHLSSAQTLGVDEAHNFLNQGSKRTRFLKSNLADQVVLFTATPINRSRTDLLRLIDILGADNFDDDTLAVFERLTSFGQGHADIHDNDLPPLQTGVASFTVRRTKPQFNAMVDLDPEAYRLPGGRVCRYPKQLSECYTLGEPEQDRELAREIRELALNFKGVSHFQKTIVLPDSYREHGVTPELYLRIRLKAARTLALYHVMSGLRSSRLALYRHIEGEHAAWTRMGLSAHDLKGDDKAGNMLERTGKLAGNIPENRLGIELPLWLTDPVEHKRACEEEWAIYSAIRERLKQMSGYREKRKVEFLTELLKRHDHILAFDHYPITLRYFLHLLNESKAGHEDFDVLLGVGGNRRSHEHIQSLLNPESQYEGKLIVLCSEALSESVNLQRASTLMHLDMPSVVRIAEQRVGRIDRMDSCHTQIEVWWPKDSPEFALRSDETFYYRMREVDTLIGGNLLLPEDMRGQHDDQIITREYFEDLMRSRESRYWDGIEDAFSPVRGLTSGPEALINPDVYELYKNETNKVLSRVSVVQSAEPWVFLCLAGEHARAPRWIFLSDSSDKPTTDLRETVNQLRARLSDELQSLNPTRAAMGMLQSFLGRLGEMEKMLLPKRKQRAIAQFEWAVALWSSYPDWITSDDQAQQVQHLLDLFDKGVEEKDLTPDWAQLADVWLELVHPRSAELMLKKGKRASMTRLRDLEPSLRAVPIALEVLLKRIQGVDLRRRWEERIVACILGYGETDRDVGDR
ncbi:SNF2-related protein [Pseudomonas sp. Irchel 3F3]|uniref:SNF2-related protein n=1 Tax=Pseudomonas sp. Irchel 3F3 TaxID=2009000 RepID=UPI0021156DC3|nr:SNF2-related protein [Pseudomonas sp. Irchel 3F3]